MSRGRTVLIYGCEVNNYHDPKGSVECTLNDPILSPLHDESSQTFNKNIRVKFSQNV